jgi:hypothetical protein
MWNEHRSGPGRNFSGDGANIFKHVCELGCEGIRGGVAMNNSAWPLIPSARLGAMTSSFFSRLDFAHRFSNGCHTFGGTN